MLVAAVDTATLTLSCALVEVVPGATSARAQERVSVAVSSAATSTSTLSTP